MPPIIICGTFDLSAAQLGLVLGAYGVGYVITTLPGGYVADRFGAVTLRERRRAGLYRTAPPIGGRARRRRRTVARGPAGPWRCPGRRRPCLFTLSGAGPTGCCCGPGAPGSHALIALAVLPLVFVDSLPAALACMTGAVSAGLGANPVFYAVIADIVPRSAGTCMGVMNSGLAISGFLAPVLTGFALGATGRFDTAFVLIALFAVSSVFVLLIWHQPDRDLARLKRLAEPGA